MSLEIPNTPRKYLAESDGHEQSSPKIPSVLPVTNRITVASVATSPSRNVAPRNSTTSERRQSYFRRSSIVLQSAQQRGMINEAVMRKLQAAKERGLDKRTLMGLTVFAAHGANPIQDPFAVTAFPVSMQLAFRRKLYGLMACEMVLTLVLAIVLLLVPAAHAFITSAVNIFAFGSIGASLLALIILYTAKYSYPFNYFTLLLFIACKAVLLASFTIRSDNRFLLVLMGTLAISMALMVLAGSIAFDFNTAQETAISIGVASLGIWVIIVIVMLVTLLGFHAFPELTTRDIWLMLLFVTILSAWFAYDAHAMLMKMALDEYMQGVIFFYTDLIVLVLLTMLLCAAALSSGDGGDAGGCVCCDDTHNDGGGDGDDLGASVSHMDDGGTVAGHYSSPPMISPLDFAIVASSDTVETAEEEEIRRRAEGEKLEEHKLPDI